MGPSWGCPAEECSILVGSLVPAFFRSLRLREALNQSSQPIDFQPERQQRMEKVKPSSQPRVLMTPAAYSRRRQVSKSAVSQAIKSGRIGTVRGPGGRKMIDVVIADRQWRERSDPTQMWKGSPSSFATTYGQNKRSRSA